MKSYRQTHIKTNPFLPPNKADLGSQTCESFFLMLSKVLWLLCRCDSMFERNSYQETEVKMAANEKRDTAITLRLAYIACAHTLRSHKFVYA